MKLRLEILKIRKTPIRQVLDGAEFLAEYAPREVLARARIKRIVKCIATVTGKSHG